MQEASYVIRTVQGPCEGSPRGHHFNIKSAIVTFETMEEGESPEIRLEVKHDYSTFLLQNHEWFREWIQKSLDYAKLPVTAMWLPEWDQSHDIALFDLVPLGKTPTEFYELMVARVSEHSRF